MSLTKQLAKGNYTRELLEDLADNGIFASGQKIHKIHKDEAQNQKELCSFILTKTKIQSEEEFKNFIQTVYFEEDEKFKEEMLQVYIATQKQSKNKPIS